MRESVILGLGEDILGEVSRRLKYATYVRDLSHIRPDTLDIGRLPHKERCKYWQDRGRALLSGAAPLFPGRVFSHRVVWFFQVVRGSAAKFIQSPNFVVHRVERQRAVARRTRGGNRN